MKTNTFTLNGQIFSKHNMLKTDFEMWETYLVWVLKGNAEAVAIAQELVGQGRLKVAQTA